MKEIEGLRGCVLFDLEEDLLLSPWNAYQGVLQLDSLFLGFGVQIFQNRQRKKADSLYMTQRRPNILITGTPGTGKTTTCELLSIASHLNHIQVGDLVKSQGLHSGYDSNFDSWILDEDQVVDALESTMEQGGNIVDHHGCDFFPERWFDLIVVLQADNSILYRRLEDR